MYPKEPSKEKRPCVVVFHGGGGVHSDKESTMSALCLPYLSQGFVVCNIEYRCGSGCAALIYEIVWPQLQLSHLSEPKPQA